LKNRCPTKAVEVTRFQAWLDKAPSLGHLRFFGWNAYC
jgi:hypothetical protein